MTVRTVLSAGLIALALTTGFGVPQRATAAGGHKKHLLVVTVTKGFRHDSIPVAEETIQKLGADTGLWETDFVRTDDEMQVKMTPEALKQYDAVCFANTTGNLPLPDPKGFFAYIKAGHGFVAMHSGGDTMHTPQHGGTSTDYVDMLGAEFITHHSQSEIEGQLMDPGFPADKLVIAAGKATSASNDVHQLSYVDGHVWHAFDEMYHYINIDREHLHMLVAMNRVPDDKGEDAGKPGEFIVSWCKAYGHGRVFYTSLGHRKEMWRDPTYQQHILGGIRFALGLSKGSTEPNPPLAPAGTVK